ncbi:MAG: TRAP transporter substrate-binding protein DctP [Chloroflexi bacterium]|nr:TRAP transporter substrate-binding protein DctP [Chloroflexota bacterium]
MSKKWQMGAVVAVTTALLVSSLSGCAPTGAPSEGEPEGAEPTYQYEWRAGTDEPQDSELGERLTAFCDEVKKETEGRVDITPYFSSTLGSWEIMGDMLMRNDVQLVYDAVNSAYDPRLAAAYYMPYLVSNYEEYWQLYGPGGLVRTLYSEIAEPLGIVQFGAVARGMSGLTTTEVPPSPGDPDVPKNMKIRVMGLKECRLTFERLGYLTTAISYDEVYSALQTGIVEGQMGGGAIQAWQFRDVQKCYIQYNDFCESLWFQMNKQSVDSLTGHDRQVIAGAADHHSREQFEYVQQMDEEYLEKLQGYGLEIIMLTQEELDACATAIRQDVWPELESMIGTVIMYQLYDALGIEY